MRLLEHPLGLPCQSRYLLHIVTVKLTCIDFILFYLKKNYKNHFDIMRHPWIEQPIK